MLPIVIPRGEFWDERNEQFVYTKEYHLQLEHSLISISNWEMKWHIAYFDSTKTVDQALDYIRCMTLTKNVPEEAYAALTSDNVTAINKYMLDPMTATTISDIKNQQRNYQKVTSELIYYWMIQFGIPFTCEKWHINRLIMLIRVCAEESKPKKKRNPKDIAADYRRINAERLAKYNTKG